MDARARAADGSRARGRRARAENLPVLAEAMAQGRILGGLRGRYRGRPFSAGAVARPDARLRLAVRRDRGRSSAAWREYRLDRRSDQRYALLSRLPAGLGGVGGAGSRWPPGAGGIIRAGD